MSITTATLRQKVHQLADQLPADATWEDVMVQARVRRSVEEGLTEADAGKLVDGNEVLRWLKSWGTEQELKPPRSR